MLLNELLGIKKLKKMKPRDLVQHLKAELKAGSNLKFLGNGNNGIALTDGTVAYKLWLYDPAYERFVKFCQKNTDNPYLPKFLSPIKTMPIFFEVSDGVRAKADNRVKYVRMELLSKYKGRTDFKIYDDPEMLKLLNQTSEVAPVVSNYIDIDSLVDAASRLSNDPKQIDAVVSICMRENGSRFNYGAHADKMNPEIAKVFEVICQLEKVAGSGGLFDIGDDNLASRGDQLVFLDPIVDEESIDFNTEYLDLWGNQ